MGRSYLPSGLTGTLDSVRQHGRAQGVWAETPRLPVRSRGPRWEGEGRRREPCEALRSAERVASRDRF